MKEKRKIYEEYQWEINKEINSIRKQQQKIAKGKNKEKTRTFMNWTVKSVHIYKDFSEIFFWIWKKGVVS